MSLEPAVPTEPQSSAGPRGSSDGDRGTIWRWFMHGPDPVEPDEPIGMLEAALPWPVRCIAVAGGALAGWAWHDSGAGQQLAWGLQYGAIALLSIVMSFWLPVLIVDSILAAIWFVKLVPFVQSPRRWKWLHIVTFVNRQVGHLQALFVCSMVALAASSHLAWQLGALLTVLLLGAPIINGIARLRWRFLDLDSSSKRSGGLLWRRRIFIYAATGLGLVALVLAAPRQADRLWPLLGALGVGLSLRVVRHIWRRRNAIASTGMPDKRAQFQSAQAEVARQVDGLVPILVVGGIVAAVGMAFWQRQRLDAELRTRLDGAAPPADRCAREPHEPVRADVSLFVMADTQTHELAGRRFPGQTELANALNRSATRPVVLDMLSAVTVKRFASIYHQLAAARSEGRPLLWAHLGDLADLACKKELERALALLDDFQGGPRTGMAGIALGNHEVGFQGSFHWSPYWPSACPSGPLRTQDARRSIEQHFAKQARERGSLGRIDGSLSRPYGGALVGVSALGVASAGGRTRGVIGVFLDTSDGGAFDWGMPGSVGSISDDQIGAARTAIASLRARRGGGYAGDPAYVLFSHIPFGELAGSSRDRVAAFVAELDGAKSAAGPRVLALISAHTHVAGAHRHCLGHRTVRELVVGSTTDPPQQAAIVDIGADEAGRLALSLRTLHAVDRPAATCPGGPHLSAGVCRKIVAQLVKAPACRELVGGAGDDRPARDCREVERPRSLAERLAALRTFIGPLDAGERREIVKTEGKELLACVCRDGACAPPDDVLAGDAYADVVAAAFARPERSDELVCLAWAASVVQAHKATGMTMAEALRCAYDDPTAPAERVSVATLEAVSCY